MLTTHKQELPHEFYARDATEVARELVGCTLLVDGIGGVIVETEAYRGNDPACHAYRGITKRNRVLFGPPGRSYVYFSYGMHNLLNLVVEREGQAAAVLIRALEPIAGAELMQQRRGTRAIRNLCSGPAKLTQALAVDLSDNNRQLLGDRFQIFSARQGDISVTATTRIGISKAADRLWRYCALGSAFLSAPITNT